MKVSVLLALAVASMAADTPAVDGYKLAIAPAADSESAIAHVEVPVPTDGAMQISATFADDIAPGDWVVFAAAIDAQGNTFGPVISAPFTVPAGEPAPPPPPADVPRLMPGSISVTLS